MGRIDAYINVTSKNLYIIVPMECVFFEFSKGLNTRNDMFQHFRSVFDHPHNEKSCLSCFFLRVKRRQEDRKSSQKQTVYRHATVVLVMLDLVYLLTITASTISLQKNTLISSMFSIL